MAKRGKTKSKTPAKGGLWPRWRRRILRGLAGVALAVLGIVVLFAIVNPPTNIYMMQESRRLGGISQEWVAWDDIAPVMARSVVAAEDANYCLHWGFDMGAIRRAIDAGGNRGASTISQQVVKNVFLWHGRNYARKAAEAVLTPMVETVWTKRRILEVYLNVAEFGEGVFGIKAAAATHFQVEPAKLTPVQAARLAAILPDPKRRNPARPTDFLRRRTASIMDGAETIRADGRAACFED
ncbi:MAG: monofunctional biosynthetic peptidoglycan transglycosylase [Pseudorhodobacter sp.]